ncbi:hypothetical protein I4200191B4_18570 [Pseudoflavonifractor gallinarum]
MAFVNGKETQKQKKHPEMPEKSPGPDQETGPGQTASPQEKTACLRSVQRDW